MAPRSIGRLGRRALNQICAALMLVIATATSANAQELAVDFSRLQGSLNRGDVVIVTDSRGRQTTSRLSDVSAESLMRQLGVSATDVREIAVERRDSVWNGALIGLAVAGTPWLITCAANDWCYYNEYGAENLLRTTAITTAVVGAGIGALFDLSKRQRFTIYQAASGRPLRIGVTPAVAVGAMAFRVTARF